jgi:hypothetical protein
LKAQKHIEEIDGLQRVAEEVRTLEARDRLAGRLSRRGEAQLLGATAEAS